jgi:hypothetical protein
MAAGSADGDPVGSLLYFVPYFGIIAASLLAVLWLLRRSRYWRLRTGTPSNWQFSLAQLLAATTIVALLAAALRHSELFGNGNVEVFGLLIGSIILPFSAVLIWSGRSHWLFKTAGVVVAAIGLGVPFFFTQFGAFMFRFAVAHFIIQSVVLMVWLAWGQVLPDRDSIDVSGSEV